MAYRRHPQHPLRADVWEFIKAMGRHWTWWASSTLISALLAVYQGGGGAIPTWALWTWVIVGIIASAFFSWRDQHHQLPVAERRQAVEACLGRCLQILTSNDPPTFTFHALSRADAHKLRTPGEVLYVCLRLLAYNYEDPLFEIEKFVPMKDWLIFLKYFKYGADVDRKHPVDAAKKWARVYYSGMATVKNDSICF